MRLAPVASTAPHRLDRGERIVAIGASAGGIEALTAVLGPIGSDFGLPILVVQHLAPDRISHLVEILAARTALRVEQARDGVRPVAGHVYVAPPGHHLAIDQGCLQLGDAAPVHFSRPSIDVLFESVARGFGDGAIGIVLSGGGSDGTDGARAIRAVGGRVIVQSEDTAVNSGMPRSVVNAGQADAVLEPKEIAAFLEREFRGD